MKLVIRYLRPRYQDHKVLYSLLLNSVDFVLFHHKFTASKSQQKTVDSSSMAKEWAQKESYKQHNKRAKLE